MSTPNLAAGIDAKGLEASIIEAVFSGPHTITADEIVLRQSWKVSGNALNQLHQRIAKVLAALPPTPDKADAAELVERLNRALATADAHAMSNSDNNMIACLIDIRDAAFEALADSHPAENTNPDAEGSPKP